MKAQIEERWMAVDEMYGTHTGIGDGKVNMGHGPTLKDFLVNERIWMQDAQYILL